MTWPYYVLAALAAGILVLLFDRSARGKKERRHADPDGDWTLDDVHAALAEGRKVEAIRRYRQITGTGLREAKLAVDGLEAGRPLPQPEGEPLPTPDETVRELAASGRKIHAIKRYREQTGAGLKEAKDVVESLLR